MTLHTFVGGCSLSRRLLSGRSVYQADGHFSEEAGRHPSPLSLLVWLSLPTPWEDFSRRERNDQREEGALSSHIDRGRVPICLPLRPSVRAPRLSAFSTSRENAPATFDGRWRGPKDECSFLWLTGWLLEGDQGCLSLSLQRATRLPIVSKLRTGCRRVPPSPPPPLPIIKIA